MGGHAVFAVACVISVFNHKTLLIGNSVSPNPSEQLCGLATEHRPQDDFDSAVDLVVHGVQKRREGLV